MNHADSLPPRTSLDSSRISYVTSPKSVSRDKGFGWPEATEEEETFEDVGLNDDVKPKKKGLFSRFGDTSSPAQTVSPKSSTLHIGFHFPGRKRGQSGGGAELGNMKGPASVEADAK